MDHDHDFSALRNLLALKRLDMPQDTQVEEFLAEFHQRQRAQLLVPEPVWTRAMNWMKEHVAGLEMIPSLSYASVAAAIAITAVIGLSQQVQVTQVDGQSKLSFRMPTQETSFALVPGSFLSTTNISPKVSETPNFTPNRTKSTATSYVLANNSHGANDATVAF